MATSSGADVRDGSLTQSPIGRAGGPPKAPAPAAPPRPRSASRRVLEWTALALCFVVLAELTSRVEDWVRFRMPIFSRVTDSGELLVNDSTGTHGRPGARYFKWSMNGLGFRGPEVAREVPPGTVRVVTTGASETFGLYESPGAEYPRQLEDSLRALASRAAWPACDGRAPRVAPRFEVVNAALPGMALPTLEQHLRTQVGPLRPDIVVLYPTPGFYLNPRAPVMRPPGDDGELTASNALQPRLLKRLRDQLKGLLPGPVLTYLRRRDIADVVADRPAGWAFESLPPERVAAFESDLRRVVGATRAIGATPVLVVNVNIAMDPQFADEAMMVAWRRQFPRASERTLVEFHAAAAESTRRIAADSGVTLLDLPQSFGGRWAGRFADFVHFTDAGASLVASALAPVVAGAAGSSVSCDRLVSEGGG